MTSTIDGQSVDDPPEIILVVEDEVLIRMEVAEYLRDCGFHVLEAASADAAIAILTAGPPIDLVFSDVQMAGSMDGFGLARWVRDRSAGVEMLLTSGLSRTTRLAEDLRSIGPMIDKPFSHTALLARIEDRLRRRERR